VITALNPGDVNRSTYSEEKEEATNADTHEATCFPTPTTNKYELPQHSINPEAYGPIWNATDMGGIGYGREVTGGTTEATLRTSQWELTQDLGKHCRASPRDVPTALNPSDVNRSVNSEEEERTTNAMLNEVTTRGHDTTYLTIAPCYIGTMYLSNKTTTRRHGTMYRSVLGLMTLMTCMVPAESSLSMTAH
jgi:hypothetical protein